MFTNIKIVLVETSHPGNIGSAARAMKTMGFNQLCLVKPKKFPDVQANELASGAIDILENASIAKSLEEALADSHLVIGTSARERDIAIPLVNPLQLVKQIHETYRDAKLAIVFGRERTGLTTAELKLCHWHVMIPTQGDYASLNLAQAVQVICYQFRIFAETSLSLSEERDDSELKSQWATHEAVENFYQHLEETLLQINFINPEQPKKLMLKLRRLFNRAHLENNEINILRGILTAVTQQNFHHD